jgi:hypothetical protein
VRAGGSLQAAIGRPSSGAVNAPNVAEGLLRVVLAGVAPPNDAQVRDGAVPAGEVDNLRASACVCLGDPTDVVRMLDDKIEGPQ